MRERDPKRMLALLLEDVTLIKQREVCLSVRFRGGATTTITVPRPLLPYESRATHPEVRKLINDLAAEYTDAQIASLLNDRGWSTGSGKSFDGEGVQWVRKIVRFKSLKDHLLEEGWMTAKELGAKTGVSRNTLRKWYINRQIKARICNDKGQWLYWPP